MQHKPNILFHLSFKKKYNSLINNGDISKKIMDFTMQKIIENHKKQNRPYGFSQLSDNFLIKSVNNYLIVYKEYENMIMFLDIEFAEILDKMKLCDICNNLLQND